MDKVYHEILKEEFVMQYVAICKECEHQILLGEQKYYMSPCPVCGGEMKVFSEETFPEMIAKKNALFCATCGYETLAFGTVGFCPACGLDLNMRSL